MTNYLSKNKQTFNKGGEKKGGNIDIIEKGMGIGGMVQVWS